MRYVWLLSQVWKVFKKILYNKINFSTRLLFVSVKYCLLIPIRFQDLVLVELVKKQRETELREIETTEL